MFDQATVLFLYAESPLHFGSGSSLGAIDLPIQRERHTQFPIGQASGIKGAMRDFAEQKEQLTPIKMELSAKERALAQLPEAPANTAGLENASNERDTLKNEVEDLQQKLAQAADHIYAAFGPDRNASEYGGALTFKDARILLFPVRSLKGVFAYATCPSLIEGFKRDLQHVGDAARKELASCDFTFPPQSEDTHFCAVSSNELTIRGASDTVILEDFTFEVHKALGEHANTLAKTLAHAIFPPPDNSAENALDPYRYWREKIQSNLVVLPDDAFRDFAQFATEVLTRIKINDDTGTVDAGALFTEEHLPAETVLYTLALATNARKQLNGSPIKKADEIIGLLHSWLAETAMMQFGGDATIGRGLVYVHSWQGEGLKA